MAAAAYLKYLAAVAATRLAPRCKCAIMTYKRSAINSARTRSGGGSK